MRCISCKEEAASGKTRCRRCLEKSRLASQKYRNNHPDQKKSTDLKQRQKNLAIGKCPQCTIRPLENGKARCKECLRKHRDNIDKKRKHRAHNLVCRECGDFLAPRSKSYCRKCLDRISTRNSNLRDKVLIAYGNKCACCGEAERSFLQIDHKNGGGRADRVSGLYSTRWYRWLIKNSFPPEYQILCANCNWGKHLNGGICPHQTRKQNHG